MEYPVDNKRHHDILPVLTFNQPTSTTQTNNIQEMKCFKCDKCYKFPADRDDYLAHLFLEHRLVVADVEDIAVLEDYLVFWQREFKDHDLEEYCTTMLLDQFPDGRPAKNEKYYLLSDILPKDYELRTQLQQKRLENALAQHQLERTDRSFSKECLYCRDVITGLRADFLAHLFNKHFLQLGKPENLVYVDDLISKVQHNLDELICLYCEKVFKDRVTLKEHMRKKAHKRINPNNRDYDRYFLSNYRNEKMRQQPQRQRSGTTPRLQRKNLTQNADASSENKQAEAVASQSIETNSSVDFEQRFASHNNNHTDNSDSEWSDWDDGESAPPLNCLFCAQQCTAFAMLKAHMTEAHSVDFDAGVESLNFYQKIKLVNYVRRQMCLLRCVTCNLRCESAEMLKQHMTTEEHYGLGVQKQWDKPEYFFPTYEDDGLLCILDDSPNDDVDDTVVRIISEDTMAQINKDAERLSLENFQYL